MTKTVELEIVSPSSITLDERSARIQACHEAGKLSAVKHAIYSLLAGLELNAAKAELPHGKFIAWREKHLPAISKSTAARYMAIGLKAAAARPEIGQFQNEPLLLASGELPKERETALLDTVRDFADGSSLQDLYREYGILKPKARQTYTAPKDQTPEQAARALEQQALDHINQLCADLEFVTPELLSLAANKDRQRLLDSLTEKSKLIRSLGRARPPGAPPRKSKSPKPKA